VQPKVAKLLPGGKKGKLVACRKKGTRKGREIENQKNGFDMTASPLCLRKAQRKKKKEGL